MKEEDIINRVRQILMQYLGTSCRLFLFGSRALGKNSPHSDFDLLVDIGRPVDSTTWSQIVDEVSALPTLYSIDLTDRQAADPKFLATIQKDLIDVTAR